MVESYTSFSADILSASEGILRFAIHGKSYAKFKTVQTLPYHCFQHVFLILNSWIWGDYDFHEYFIPDNHSIPLP